MTTVSFPGKAQGIANTADGVDQRRTFGIDLLAQVADVGLEDPGVATEVVTPDVIEKLRARKHAARVEHHVAQQPKLRGRELDRPAVPGDLERVLVELQIGVAQPTGRLLDDAGAPQDVAKPRDQLLEAEWLGDVVIA